VGTRNLVSGVNALGIIFAFSKLLLVEVSTSVFKLVHYSVSVSLTNGSEFAENPFSGSTSLNSPFSHPRLQVGSSPQAQKSRRKGQSQQIVLSYHGTLVVSADTILTTF